MDITSRQTSGKEKKSLSRLWKKVRAAFKDKKTTLPTAPTITPSKPAEAPKSMPEEQTTKPSESRSEPATNTIEVDVPVQTEEDAPTQNEVDRRLERAKALFKKYDLDLDTSEWQWEEKQSRPTERVQKTIRMRVRYTCHSCNTVFGSDKVCITCQHPRCNKCIRYPPRKPKVKKKVVDASPEEKEETKCACHECQTDFDMGAEECPNCHHKICQECLKEALVAVSPPPNTETPNKTAPPEQAVANPVAVAAS